MVPRPWSKTEAMNTTIVEANRDFFSIGQLAAHLQTSVRSIEKAARTRGIVPAMRINLVPHYDGQQVEIIADELRQTGS